MAKRDFYEVLGVPKNAGDDEIKKAYRKLAMKHHPDRNQGDAAKAAEERFKEAKEAYEMLSDPQKKAAYDQYGHAGVDPNMRGGPGGAEGFGGFGESFGDIFGDIVGGARGRGGPPAPRETRVVPDVPRGSSDRHTTLHCAAEVSGAHVVTEILGYFVARECADVFFCFIM